MKVIKSVDTVTLVLINGYKERAEDDDKDMDKIYILPGHGIFEISPLDNGDGINIKVIGAYAKASSFKSNVHVSVDIMTIYPTEDD